MMSDETLYRLGDSTAVEPLVNNWVAWSHVISPVASSLHLQNYQIDVLQAYLKDPKMHVNACRTPQLRSGRFVNIPEFRVPEVRAFLADSRPDRRAAEEASQARAAHAFRDRLAREGMRFDHCFAENSICTPSRAASAIESYGARTLRSLSK